MSEIKTKNALIRIINNLIEPYVWESGWSDDGNGHIYLWAPTKAKVFPRNEEIKELISIYKDHIGYDAHAGGMCVINMRKVPNCDLATILDWLLHKLKSNQVSTQETRT